MKCVYQIVEITPESDPVGITPLGTARRSLVQASEGLAEFLWEQVGQQEGDRPAEWFKEIGLIKFLDKNGHVGYCNPDGDFEWRIIEITL